MLFLLSYLVGSIPRGNPSLDQLVDLLELILRVVYKVFLVSVLFLDFLEEIGMLGSKPVDSPMEANFHLSSNVGSMQTRRDIRDLWADCTLDQILHMPWESSANLCMSHV